MFFAFSLLSSFFFLPAVSKQMRTFGIIFIYAHSRDPLKLWINTDMNNERGSGGGGRRRDEVGGEI